MFSIKSKIHNSYVSDISVNWSAKDGQKVSVGFLENQNSKLIYKVDSKSKLEYIIKILSENGYDINSLEIVEVT